MSKNTNLDLNALIQKRIEKEINDRIEKEIAKKINDSVNEALGQFFGSKETAEPTAELTDEPETQEPEKTSSEEVSPETNSSNITQCTDQELVTALGENIPPSPKTEQEIYQEEFDLRMSRPGLTKEELQNDLRWQRFLAERPGPKMAIVYKDYLAVREREHLLEENRELRKRLAETNAEYVLFKQELDKLIPNASNDVKCRLEESKRMGREDKGPESESDYDGMEQSGMEQLGGLTDKVGQTKQVAKHFKGYGKLEYNNLRKFVEDQHLTQAEFIDFIGLKEGANKKNKETYLSNIINNRVANTRPFWKAVKHAFGLSPEQMSELKKLKSKRTLAKELANEMENKLAQADTKSVEDDLD